MQQRYKEAVEKLLAESYSMTEDSVASSGASATASAAAASGASAIASAAVTMSEEVEDDKEGDTLEW